MEFLRNALFVFIIGVVVVVVVVVIMVIVVVLLSSVRVLRPAHIRCAEEERTQNTRFSRSKRTSLGRLTFHRSRVLLINIKKHRRESE